MKHPLRRFAVISTGAACALVGAMFVTVPTANATSTPAFAQVPAAASAVPDAPAGALNIPAVGINAGPLIGTDGRIIAGPNDPGVDDLVDETLAKLEADPNLHQAALDAAAAATGTATGTDRAAVPAPEATIPDPTDFDTFPEDPADYRIPAAAKKYFDGDVYQIPRPTPGGPAAGKSVPGLEEFYGQKLDWEPCADYDPTGGDEYSQQGLECAYLIVPIDYSNPDGPTAAIGLLKYPAANEDAKIGTLFADPGGPGGSGMSLAASFAKSGLPASLHDTFDFVGFDPRGVSSSLPMIRCESSAAFDAQRYASDIVTNEQAVAILKYNTEQCYQNTGKAFGIDGATFLGSIGTVNVVRDLDIARAAVGDAKLSYLGFSYGTSIGYQYAQAFPENIRALVLDGVVNPFENNGSELAKYSEYLGNATVDPLAQLKGFQGTLNQFMKRCAEENGFEVDGVKVPCALGTSGDLDEMMENYQAISQLAWGGSYYETKDADPSKRRPLSFADMTLGTIMAMYADKLWPMYNLALSELKNSQDATGILGLADMYYERDESGGYSFSDPAFQSITCTDAGLPLPGEGGGGGGAFENPYVVAPFIDEGVNPDGSPRFAGYGGDPCSYYKTQHTMPQGQTLTAMPNVLVISTSYDPATPYQNGVVAAAAIGGTLLSVAGVSHTSFLRTSQCTDDITIGYLNNLTVDANNPGKTGVETKDIHSNVITGNECDVTSFRATPQLESATVAAGKSLEVTATGLVRGDHYEVTLPEGATLQDAAGTAPVVTADTTGTAKFTVLVADDTKAGEYPVKLTPVAGENDPLVQPEGKLTVTAASTDTTDDSDGSQVDDTTEPTDNGDGSQVDDTTEPTDDGGGSQVDDTTEPTDNGDGSQVDDTTEPTDDGGGSHVDDTTNTTDTGDGPKVDDTAQQGNKVTSDDTNATNDKKVDGVKRLGPVEIPVQPTKDAKPSSTAAAPTKDGLASTGADLSPVLGASILLLLTAGGTLLLVQRRRSTR